MQGWLRIPKQAAKYSAISPRLVEDWLHNGLRFVKVGGVRLTRPDWIDDFLLKYETSQSCVESIVDEIVKSL